jgi:hypothetical protein
MGIVGGGGKRATQLRPWIFRENIGLKKKEMHYKSAKESRMTGHRSGDGNQEEFFFSSPLCPGPTLGSSAY